MEEKTKKILEYYNEKLLKKDVFSLKDTSSFSHPGYISNAAIQAPVILMSQNRQSEKEAEISRSDYEVDKEAHRRILEIEKKLDKLLEKEKKWFKGRF